MFTILTDLHTRGDSSLEAVESIGRGGLAPDPLWLLTIYIPYGDSSVEAEESQKGGISTRSAAVAQHTYHTYLLTYLATMNTTWDSSVDELLLVYT